MFYTLDRAVEITGLKKSTILGAIECGQISAVKDWFGEWQIEHGELCQIYSPLAENDGASPSAACYEGTLEADIAALVKEAGDSLRSLPTGCHGEQLPPADLSETGEHSGWRPKNIHLRVKDPCIDRPAWDPGIRIRDADRISPPDANGTHSALVTRAILGTLGIGCILGSVAYFFPRSLSTPANKIEISVPSFDSKNPVAIEPDRQAVSTSPSTDPIAALAARVAAQPPAHRARAGKSATVGQQNVASTATPNVERHPKPSSRQIPFPETRPSTIEGWTVRDVVGGTATLEGPTGIWRVKRGDKLPGVGGVASIVRWGNYWIVVTSRGLISTP